MKKLTIATAVAALACGAFASNVCDTQPGVAVTASQRVYDLTMSLKTVGPKVGSSTVKSTDCLTGTTSSKVYGYYRVKSSRTVKGIILDCDVCGVEAQTAGDNLALSTASMYVSTSASKFSDVYEAGVYGNTAPGYKVGLLNFIGGPTFQTSKVAEMSVLFQFVEVEDSSLHEKAYSIFAAGFGARDGALLKNVSGNCAGESTATTYCGIPTQCFEPCLTTAYYENLAVDNNGITFDVLTWQLARSPAYDAVYGTWSLKYNASKSKLAYLDTLLVKTFGKNYSLIDPADGYLGGLSTFPFDVTFN